jgi:chromosome segregation ATPase
VQVVEKRIKNTEAARRSRLRKTLKMDQLEHKVEDLEREKEELLEKMAAIEHERDEWKARCHQLSLRVQGR